LNHDKRTESESTSLAEDPCNCWESIRNLKFDESEFYRCRMEGAQEGSTFLEGSKRHSLVPPTLQSSDLALSFNGIRGVGNFFLLDCESEELVSIVWSQT
jgi:hypothetical protein